MATAVLVRFAAALTAIATTASASFVDNGKVTDLNGTLYYVGGVPVATLQGLQGDSVLEKSKLPSLDIFPMTVIHTNNSRFGEGELAATVSEYSSNDDVFHEEFLRTIYLAPETNMTAPLASPLAFPRLRNEVLLAAGTFMTSSQNRTIVAYLSVDLPRGPYFVSAATGEVFKAYRLYPDDYLAFIHGAVSDERDGFLALPCTAENVMAKSIAVPSRLYYTATPEKPLAGLRFGVKDIYHVKGLKTSGGNRAYYYLYGTQNKTAPSVQRLIDLGAVFVGKTGTVQFANGDKPTADWVDLHCPFNPRGDGYQIPSGSSSGSAAAIAAYDWLDFAVGSDTGGSMRSPAGVQGLYGNRPSTGAISMANVLPLSTALDTAGVFTRSAALWSRITHTWYPNASSTAHALPTAIYYNTRTAGWHNSTAVPAAATAALNTFLTHLESFLHARRTAVDISAHWAATHPPAAPSNVSDLLSLAYGILTAVDQWTALGAPLFADYAAAHAGRRPYINPGPLARWRWGQAHGGAAARAAALRNMTVFRAWWETAGFGRTPADGDDAAAARCSDGLYVWPKALGTPSYRDEYFAATPAPPLGFADWNLAGWAGAPEVVVPVGEAPYESRVTGLTEWLPVAVSLLAPRGCDGMLARLVGELEGAGVLRPVKAGARLWGGEEERPERV